MGNPLITNNFDDATDIDIKKYFVDEFGAFESQIPSIFGIDNSTIFPLYRPNVLS